MKGIKPITNPMLTGAMELMKASDTVEHRQMFIGEMIHAKFLSPVVINPQPVPDENGISKIDKDAKIQVPMLTAPDGKHFFMAFTDLDELQKWNKEGGQQIFGFSFADYVGMVKNSKEASNGFVINPYSHNIVMTTEMMDVIVQNNPNIFKEKN